MLKKIIAFFLSNRFGDRVASMLTFVEHKCPVSVTFRKFLSASGVHSLMFRWTRL